MTPPAVSIPSDKGATSRRRRSCVFSDVLPERMAAGQRHCRRQPRRVDALVGLLAIEEVGNKLDNTGNTSGTADEYDLVHVGLVDL